MEELEEQASEKVGWAPPCLWKRFVDDIISILWKREVQSNLDFLNTQHKRIEFTMEMEIDGSLPFMDVRFTRQNDGKLRREVYQQVYPV